jgi:hypothetical protein
MSETQSEHYTTPEFAASLSLPGGGASLGASPLGEHVTALNDPGRRMDSRTLQVQYLWDCKTSRPLQLSGSTSVEITSKNPPVF